MTFSADKLYSLWEKVSKTFELLNIKFEKLFYISSSSSMQLQNYGEVDTFDFQNVNFQLIMKSLLNLNTIRENEENIIELWKFCTFF